ncbi:hypothetical protein TRIUR3_22045 [Triticum urartu]|uniref:glutathione transferase n=1 Tax=Triticum urartu TaxID=4572 RepID=M7YYJ6_TRIUA|nr:hypothetical protein TRIUR3_22045 [Triticum urartu]
MVRVLVCLEEVGTEYELVDIDFHGKGHKPLSTSPGMNVDESLEKAKKVLEIYEARPSKHKYLAGDFVSFADLNHFACTFYLMDATPYASLFDLYPHVKAWWEDMMSRPSMKKLGAGSLV